MMCDVCVFYGGEIERERERERERECRVRDVTSVVTETVQKIWGR